MIIISERFGVNLNMLFAQIWEYQLDAYTHTGNDDRGKRAYIIYIWNDELLPIHDIVIGTGNKHIMREKNEYDVQSKHTNILSYFMYRTVCTFYVAEKGVSR